MIQSPAQSYQEGAGRAVTRKSIAGYHVALIQRPAPSYLEAAGCAVTRESII